MCTSPHPAFGCKQGAGGGASGPPSWRLHPEWGCGPPFFRSASEFRMHLFASGMGMRAAFAFSPLRIRIPDAFASGMGMRAAFPPPPHPDSGCICIPHRNATQQPRIAPPNTKSRVHPRAGPLRNHTHPAPGCVAPPIPGFGCFSCIPPPNAQARASRNSPAFAPVAVECVVSGCASANFDLPLQTGRATHR